VLPHSVTNLLTSQHLLQRDGCDHHLAQRSHNEGPDSLLLHRLEVNAQPHSGKGQQKRKRERFTRLVIWSLLNTLRLANSKISRNPSTNLGNFCHRNAALLPPRGGLSAFFRTAYFFIG
jgi:hypothetical protein